MLKNTLDWTSRQSENESPLGCYKGKVAGIMSASPGRLGGLRGLVHVRSILENMGVMVIPEQISISGANLAFDEDKSLKDKRQEEKVKKLVQISRKHWQNYLVNDVYHTIRLEILENLKNEIFYFHKSTVFSLDCDIPLKNQVN